MKKAFGLIEIIITLTLLLVLFFAVFNKNADNNPVEQHKKVQSQKQVIDEKINEIQKLNEENIKAQEKIFQQEY